MFLMEGASDFCSRTANAWQVVGYVLTVFKIIIPLLLIIFGMFDLGKAVTSSKEDEIKKATMGLMRRAIAAVVIFFIPTLVGVIMGLISGFNDNKGDYDICRKCLTSPNSGKDEKYSADSKNCAPHAAEAWK